MHRKCSSACRIATSSVSSGSNMTKPKPALRGLLAYVVLGIAVLFRTVSAANPEAQVEAGRVDLILWFDTEDYLLPADDDAAKRLAEMLTERGIRATFKIVGEKARTLARRG